MTLVQISISLILYINEIGFGQNYCDNSSVPESCRNLTQENQYISCRAVHILQSIFYDSVLKDWHDDGGWWNTANTIESLINYCNVANLCDDELLKKIYEVTDAHTVRIKHGHQFYDDIQWWSLAMIRLYEFGGNKTYLDKAMQFYDYVWEHSWDNTTCQGGLWWNIEKTYKNAITNELGLTNTAKLYMITHNGKYKEQFNLIWNWFYATGMINKQWLINDGLDVDSSNQQICPNNHETEWTYNQGVLLGGLSKMYLIDHYNTSLVNISWNIIESVIKLLATMKSNINILHEQASDQSVADSPDASQFKGIFMRYLMYFYQDVILTDKTNKYAEMKQVIISFVNDQLDAIYDNCMNPKCYGEFSAVWNVSWNKSVNAAVAQVSAIDAYNFAFIL